MHTDIGASIIQLISDFGSRSAVPLLSFGVAILIFFLALLRRPAKKIFGYLINKDGRRFVLYSENLVGSKRGADVRLSKEKIPAFGIIKANTNGSFTLISLKGEFKTSHKNNPNELFLKKGDKLRAGSESFSFEALPEEEHGKETGKMPLILRLAALVLVSILGVICFTFEYRTHGTGKIAASYAILTADIWFYAVCCVLLKLLPSPSGIAALLLCVFNLIVTAAYNPSALFIQTLCITIGLLGYFAFMILLRKEGLQTVVRFAAMSAGVALLILNVLNSGTLLGARNWLTIGGISFQPSELAKVSLILAGADTLKGSQRRINRLAFMAYAAFCVICLAVISDFGTALIFFCAFLTVEWILSGITDVLLSLAAAVAGCGLVAIIKSGTISYVINRISNCGTAWENPLTSGFQQSRAMMASASGGFFGTGLGTGWLGEVFASGSDMPFAIIWEEAGFITAVAAALCVCIIVWCAFRAAMHCGSCFHAVCACGAGAVLSVQTVLNICGTMDLLPFTGVTFPFMSSGGSSMISCWLLLAIITSADDLAFPVVNKKVDEKL